MGVTCWDSSQLQELQKMKITLLFSSTVAICLAGPQYLRNYGISSNLRSQSYSRNFAIQRVPSGFGGLSSLGLGLRGNHGAQGNYFGYPNGGQLKTYSNFQNYLSKTPVPFSEPARVDDIIPPAQTGNYFGKQLDQVAILPAAASGLAYMRNYFGKDDLCGESGLAYMETILSGGSGVQAQANAEAAYKAAWARGARILPGSACAASEVAFKEAYASGIADAILESARAFVDDTLTASSSGYDPVCAASALAYMDAFASGKDPLTSNLIAAKAFFLEYTKGTTPGVDSPCVKATLAYASRSPSPSPANRDAMVAFINQAVNDREAFFDPVCGAATIAFLDAKIAGKSDKEAGAASAEAYIEAFAANGGRR